VEAAFACKIFYKGKIMPKKRIGIIGAGDIGFNLAELLALRGFDVIIHNRYHAVDGRPSPYWLSKMGTVMDMNDSLQLPGCGEVTLTHDLNDLNGAFATVITAGAKRTHIDETREELAGKNAVIMKGFIPYISANPDTLILIVSNPVDSLTQCLIESTAAATGRGMDEIGRKIVGVSYIDTMRLKNAVKEFLSEAHPSVKSPEVEGLALGEHGPSMVPLISHVIINGQPLSDYASKEQSNAIARQTVLRGNDIIKLTGASSVVGPAHAVMHMILEIAGNITVELPCSVWDGARAIGKMAEFHRGSVKRIMDVPMNEEETQKLRLSEQALDKQYADIMTRI
jgi:malate dehydrogenase